MSKRKNPFGEISSQQRKVHVGPKEAACQEELQHVYAYTKALLFQGANPSISRQSLQAVGGLNGFLGTIHRKGVGASPSRDKAAPTCTHCPLPGSAECCHCEKPVCTDCTRVCSTCNQGYCHFCTVLSYDQTDVHAVCLNCLPIRQ